ncbi:hepatocyte growth factor receptor-like [Planococcus citri]|uniref:hepatocyte growth factor receptor-like n=1 Tax=Planococcus citri TaxID=170843 RepID=UPI0031F900E4
MANSQIPLHMNHFYDAAYASWLVLIILCLLQKNVAHSQTEDDKDTKIFLEKQDTTKFNHLVVDEDRGFVFIGAVDLLYQLTSDLELVASWRLDNSTLKCDDFKNISKGVKKSIANYNKILVLDYKYSQLISCWSTCYGLCKIYSVKNPLTEMNTEIKPIVSRDENASTVAFTVSDPKVVAGNTVLYVGATITTSQSKVPAISTIRLYQYPEYISSHGSIALKDAYLGKYIINYIYGFSSGDFIYFLTTQMKSTQPSLYISKLIRASQKKVSYFSYTEIPIECFDETEKKYNLAQAAFIGKPSFELANSLGITPQDDVLFGIFAQSVKQTVGYESSKPNNRSAMCMYSLKEINEKFIQNIQRCCKGTGYRGLEFILPPDQRCMKKNMSADDVGIINMPLEGNSPVKTNASIIFDTLGTAVRAPAQSYPNNFTTVFVGTNTGHLKQVVVRNKSNTYKYKDIAIDEGFAINSDLHFDSKTDHLYIMTERKLTKIRISFPIPSISSFQPTLGLFGDVINITIRGNNLDCSSYDTQYTSIAVAGIPCTARRPLHSSEIVCTINTRSINSSERKEYEGPIEIRVNDITTKSEEHFGIFDPKIERIFPTEGSLYGGNKLSIYGENFKAKSSVNVYIGNISCSVFHRDENEIACITGPSPVLKSNIAIKFGENFRIFNNTYKYFDTDLDEEGHNLTLKGIPAGGLSIYMHINLWLKKTSIEKLFFQVNNNSQTYNSTKCEVKNSTTFSCLSPHMPDIDRYSIIAKNPQVFNYTLVASLNRTNAGNPIIIKSFKFFVHPNPVFEHWSATELDENIRFVIKGRHIDDVCRMNDFMVRVGDKNCKILILSRSDLTCQVQKSSLKYNYPKNTAELDFSTAYGNVTVQIGNNAEQVVPYFNADIPVTTSEKFEYNWIVYAVCFGAFIFIVIFSLLIKLLIAYRKKSFESLKMSREMQQQINRMGMNAIAMRQCIKQIVVEKKIEVDGSLANILKLPNITIEYAPVTETNEETPPGMEFSLPLDTKWEFPREKLVLGRFLGEGEFGTVVLSEALGIIDENITTTVAVKMLKETHSDADMIDLVSEMEVMKLIGMHPNVLRLLGCCTQNGPLLIITEYAEYGNLRDFLHKRLPSANNTSTRSNLPQKTLITFGLQVAQGMRYLSSMKCVHRDLAARNILVSNNLVLKIADFGLARDIRNKDYYRKKTGGRLPVKWMAPEALHHKLYTTQSDVWSFGVLLWEIVTSGSLPYPTFIKMEELVQAIDDGYRMKKPQNCSMKMYSIMRECWNYLPEDRPTFLMIVENLEEMLSSADDIEMLDEIVSCEPGTIEIDNEATELDYLFE